MHTCQCLVCVVVLVSEDVETLLPQNRVRLQNQKVHYVFERFLPCCKCVFSSSFCTVFLTAATRLHAQMCLHRAFSQKIDSVFAEGPSQPSPHTLMAWLLLPNSGSPLSYQLRYVLVLQCRATVSAGGGCHAWAHKDGGGGDGCLHWEGLHACMHMQLPYFQ